MAATEAKSSDSLQDDLKCPVCQGIFVDATILPNCGHTFCRRCLREYFRSCRNPGHMVCPVCRKITKFTSVKAVDGFPANVTVNRIVENYRQDHGCKTETRPKCTACRRQGDAETFCKTCDKYLCERCLTSHQEMSVMFEGHEIVSIEETKGLKGKKSLKPQNPRLGLGSTSRSGHKLEVIRSVDLKGKMKVMTKYSSNSVAIGVSSFPMARGDKDISGVHIIDSTGKKIRHPEMPPNMSCESMMFQQDLSFSISNGGRLHVYSKNGEKKSTFMRRMTHLRLSSGLSDEIIITNSENWVDIYNSTGSICEHNISTKHIVSQASVTSSGLIVTSSCNERDFSMHRMQEIDHPSVVTVYDRDGNAGESLQAPKDVYLYAAVDEQDRVYVASVDCKNKEPLAQLLGKNNNMVIRLYDIVGLNLKERVGFNAPNFRCAWSEWCYLVSLSQDMLAFASGDILYFIKVIGGNLSQ